MPIALGGMAGALAARAGALRFGARLDVLEGAARRRAAGLRGVDVRADFEAPRLRAGERLGRDRFRVAMALPPRGCNLTIEG
jgi:hypothetical protein